MSDRDIFLVEIARRGRDSAPAPVDYATMRADVAELTSRPAITALTDLPDVSGTPADGDIIVWDAGLHAWLIQTPAPSLSVTDTESVDLTLSGNQLTADVRFGGTGTSSKVAREDHTHSEIKTARQEFGPGAYMSSGTRNLVSTSVTLVKDIRYLVVATLTMQMRGADPGPCYYRQAITIGGVSQSTPSGSSGFWCVQGVPDRTPYTYRRWLDGAGTAVTISAAVSYDGGGGFYTDHGVLEITAYPNR